MSIRPQGKFIKQHKHTSRRQNNTVCNGRRHTIGVVTIQQFLTTSIILLNDPTAMICSHKHKMSRQIAETNLHYQPEAEEPLKSMCLMICLPFILQIPLTSILLVDTHTGAKFPRRCCDTLPGMRVPDSDRLYELVAIQLGLQMRRNLLLYPADQLRNTVCDKG